MKLEYGKVFVGAVAMACLSSGLVLGSVTPAAAGAYGEEEETSEAPAAAPAPVAAVEEEETSVLGDWIPGTFSASVTLISDYSFRGVSQTQRDFALQGGVTYKPWAGLYIGAWGSSINFAQSNPPDNCALTDSCDYEDTYLEQDFFAGWASSVGDLSYDLSATYLWYPGESHWSYWEFAAKMSYALGFMTPKVGLVWSPNYFGFADDGIYASTGINVPIPLPTERVGLSVDGNFGYTWTDNEGKDGDALFFENNGDTAEQYIDWNAGLIVALHKNVSVDLRYVDTNLKLRDGDARFVGGVTFSF